jgi:hypothetical protein
MKKILLGLAFLLCSCTMPISYNDTHSPNNPNANLLPAMHTKYNLANLKAAFSDVTDDKGKPDYAMRNVMADDAVSIFEQDVENNITVGKGEKKGYISLRIQTVQLEYSLPIRTASVATLGLLNIVGFPVDKHTQTMDVEVEIMDKKQGVIKRYTQTVESSAYRAFYWGYKRKNVNRKVSADNVKKAMALIRNQINTDAPEIKQKLEQQNTRKKQNKSKKKK